MNKVQAIDNTKWVACINAIFLDGKIPESKTWYDKNEIIYILNLIGTSTDNYMLLPRSGGIELTGCENKSYYADLIGGSNYSIVPLQLTFEGFNDNLSESYFRLECITTFYGNRSALEPVVDFSEEYRTYRPFGTYGANYMLDMASFLVVNKSSQYIKRNITDLALHEKLTATELRRYVESLIFRDSFK